MRAAATYSAKVKGIKGFSISVVPDELVFKDKYEKQSFTQDRTLERFSLTLHS
ncbi:hypothetical protein ACMD2_19186 [Ananas comosus]|uniref:Subtilisin-like protease fibronectin type-III domain-containing protein n=1 Tax=Ananas comosus TaxID=4615 RepID=A0A199VW31_ANACO|nr:hypothetical protein ACMD2_19186 [Ananas comosus]